jgi:hypothetical protein
VKPSVEQLENLLALKRHERPEEDYWQGFLCEFHQRQREQATVKSGVANFFGQISNWLSDMGPSKWAYGTGLAYASVAAIFLLNPRNVEEEHFQATPVNFSVVPAPAPPVEQLDQLDLSPSTSGSVGEQVF